MCLILSLKVILIISCYHFFIREKIKLQVTNLKYFNDDHNYLKAEILFILSNCSHECYVKHFIKKFKKIPIST